MALRHFCPYNQGRYIGLGILTTQVYQLKKKIRNPLTPTMSDSDDLFKLFAPSYYFDKPRQYDDSDWFIVAEQSISVDEEAFWAVVVSILSQSRVEPTHQAHMLFLRLTNCNPLCAEKMDSGT